MGAACNSMCGPAAAVVETQAGGVGGHEEELDLEAYYGPPPEKGVTAKLVAQGADVTSNSHFIREALETHNQLRARHGAPPLKWSNECAAKAQLAADAAVARRQLFHSHSQEYGHGQNAFQGTPGAFGAREAVESWYEEVDRPGYRWPANPPAPGTGHFSQVVWKDTAEVGMACDRERGGYIYANYWPAGNVIGIYDKNVFPRDTPMQKRKTVRREPFSKTVTAVTAEVQSVLDSVNNENVVEDIKRKIKEGWTTTLDYKPAPNGYLKYTFQKGGATSSGQVGVV